MSSAINSRMICLQCLCFGSYLFANVLLYMEIILFSIIDDPSIEEKKRHAKIVMVVWILNILFSFVTQTSLILIFLEIGKKNIFKVTIEDKTNQRESEAPASSRWQTVKLSCESPNMIIRVDCDITSSDVNEDTRDYLLDSELGRPTDVEQKQGFGGLPFEMNENQRRTLKFTAEIQ